MDHPSRLLPLILAPLEPRVNAMELDDMPRDNRSNAFIKYFHRSNEKQKRLMTKRSQYWFITARVYVRLLLSRKNNGFTDNFTTKY